MAPATELKDGSEFLFLGIKLNLSLSNIKPRHPTNHRKIGGKTGGKESQDPDDHPLIHKARDFCTTAFSAGSKISNPVPLSIAWNRIIMFSEG
ncbi:hypothetical protein AKJ28_12650 [Corynebacterium glutamicum]|nr:hypothetical protein AKJ28_12650 [Corynebacterium glutamicum]